MPRAKPGQRFGGRRKGTPNKATTEIRAIASQYTVEAVEELARIAFHSKSDFARIAAIKELLDRAHAKSVMPVQHSGETRITHEDALKQIGERIAELDAEEAKNKVH